MKHARIKIFEVDKGELPEKDCKVLAWSQFAAARPQVLDFKAKRKRFYLGYCWIIPRFYIRLNIFEQTAASLTVGDVDNYLRQLKREKA